MLITNKFFNDTSIFTALKGVSIPFHCILNILGELFQQAYMSNIAKLVVLIMNFNNAIK